LRSPILIDCISEVWAIAFYQKYWLDVEIVWGLVGSLRKFISPTEPNLKKEKENPRRGIGLVSSFLRLDLAKASLIGSTKVLCCAWTAVTILCIISYQDSFINPARDLNLTSPTKP